MTDFQFKAIMAMVHEMLNKCKSLEELEETKKAIARLSGNLNEFNNYDKFLGDTDK